MYIDPNNRQGIYVSDPNKVINVTPSNTTSGNGIFSQMNTGPYNDPWENPMKEIELRLKKLEIENKFLRLKILSMEGKFSQEEVTNIRKMLISEDEASKTLAETIIDNA
jgi:hypothetical protein